MKKLGKGTIKKIALISISSIYTIFFIMVLTMPFGSKISNYVGNIINNVRDNVSLPISLDDNYFEFTDFRENITMGKNEVFPYQINNLIKRSYDDPSKIKLDGYDIDLEKRRVFNHENEIVLTTKEYDLLVYFITNKGLAISREQVLNKVWDENYYGSDRVVDDTLRRLRKKMPEINVRTIYGFGYRLD